MVLKGLTGFFLVSIDLLMLSILLKFQFVIGAVTMYLVNVHLFSQEWSVELF